MKIVINKEYEWLRAFIEKIPFVFSEEGNLIYEARNQLKAYQVKGLDIVVKSFKKPHLFNRLVYTFFRPSKAKRSYEYALELLGKGVATPYPIAYIEEKRNGLLNRSYYISVYEKEYDHIRFYMNGEQTDDNLLKETARFIANFHNKGVYHLDMSPGNILYKIEGDTYSFLLVDNNRMLFKKKISPRERYKSFGRLSNNAEVIDQMASEYAKECGLDEAEAKKAMKKYSSDFFHVKL